VRIERRFTRRGQSPYEGLPFVKRSSEIRNPDGSTVFKLENIDIPEPWSQLAIDILAQKYFRKAEVPQRDEQGNPIVGPDGKPQLGGERDSRQVFERLAGCWTSWGKNFGYFKTRKIPMPSMMSSVTCSRIRWPHPILPSGLTRDFILPMGFQGLRKGIFMSILRPVKLSKPPTRLNIRNRTLVSFSPLRTTWSPRAVSWISGCEKRACSNTDQGPGPTFPSFAAMANRCPAAAARPD